MSRRPPTRRLFLRDGAIALAAWGVAPSLLARVAAAADRRSDTVLVTVFLRGGLDALAAAPRLAEPLAARWRPRLHLPAAADRDQRPVDLDGRFGLHPALADLEPWWRRDRLAVVHGVGQPEPTRSHFDAQRNLERATDPAGAAESGWLGRAAGALPQRSGAAVTAVACGRSLPQALRGGVGALVVPSLEALSLPIRRGSSLEAALEASWRRFPDPRLRQAGGAASAALALATRARQARPTDPRLDASPLGRALADVAAIVRADAGLRVAFVEFGGWDTHSRQGSASGLFADAARDLAGSLAAFMAVLGEHRERVVVLTMTEFGRTVAENGSGGTDHGRASCFFVLGDRVRGGRVLGRIPELAPENLEDGRDLPVTVDYREVLAGVAGPHLGLRDLAPLFPGWRGKPLTLLKKA